MSYVVATLLISRTCFLNMFLYNLHVRCSGAITFTIHIHAINVTAVHNVVFWYPATLFFSEYNKNN
jgi:hypothetical protein